MKIVVKVSLLVSVIMIMVNCKDEILLNSINKNSILVVDGFISNEPGPYIIKLSLASSLENLQLAPLENCLVTLYEDTGKEETLTEEEPGVYTTKQDGIQGKIGNEYKISIITRDGKVFWSTFQKMEPPVPVDSVYYEFTKLESLDYPFGLPGYQFYIDTEGDPERECYFLDDG